MCRGAGCLVFPRQQQILRRRHQQWGNFGGAGAVAGTIARDHGNSYPSRGGDEVERSNGAAKFARAQQGYPTRGFGAEPPQLRRAAQAFIQHDTRIQLIGHVRQVAVGARASGSSRAQNG